ncbi:hypothetical protein E4P40_22380 [Blastococcus sp. CT_GayMR20]|uniref:hypothetical protein n=1 Tax=Blastococcus sp. CT_GayMR20 TaxID=2559609 RepID=UPI0010735EED|nr:hypothetical protein [Blastococcus sp. CT_GayMR20]TFV69355.1 hypothetical protein E4P40_22345 [Blastococcus sp. CT_GayMR20]TFV69362.1 hypothetical protein E4P40_22380 [Blastococcus sp. CT_GayMR20]
MNRTVRNGLAIAGMAGGMLFLGQAVASADTDASSSANGGAVAGSANASSGSGATTGAAASGDLASTTTGGGGSGGADGGTAVSSNEQEVEAENKVDNTARTGTIDASGGTSWVTVVAGNGNTQAAGSGGDGNVAATQNVTTTATVASSANGGTVSGSNNAAAGNGASYSANASGNLSSNTTGGNGSGSRSDGGNAFSRNSQDVDAENDVENDARSGDIYAHGGVSDVFVLAGNGNRQFAHSDDSSRCEASMARTSNQRCYHEGDGDVRATQNVATDVRIRSEANGGSVHNSNNAAAGNGARYHADADGDLNSRTTGGSGSGSGGDGGDAVSRNNQDLDAENDVDNDARTGDIDVSGGDSIVEVIAGNGNKQYCWSNEGDVTCTQNITTIINIISMANGGNVSCSNNAAAGNADNWVCKVDAPAAAAPAAAAAAKPAEHKPAVAPVRHAAPHRAAVSPTAQPKGQLAYTGAEVSFPLTLGLLALGAGGALTLAGRRRSTTAAV